MDNTTGTAARPYILAETNWKSVQQTRYEVAILPWGATEAHNYHLPYGTDTFQADFVAEAAVKLAWEKGARLVLLPTIGYGVNTGQLDIPLCMNMMPATQLAILRDIADVLVRCGIPKLVIFNGHGGNDFKTMIRELSVQFPQLFVCSLNWFRAAPAKPFFDDPGDHAGELETSAMLHIAPQWVRPLNEAGDGATRAFRPKGLKDGWVTAQRQWTKVSRDTGVGNPATATAEKGARFLEACISNIAGFLAELAQTPLDDLYE